MLEQLDRLQSALQSRYTIERQLAYGQPGTVTVEQVAGRARVSEKEINRLLSAGVLTTPVQGLASMRETNARRGRALVRVVRASAGAGRSRLAEPPGRKRARSYERADQHPTASRLFAVGVGERVR